MQAGEIVRIIDRGDSIQVLCHDNGNLLSVYFEYTPFVSFYRLTRKAGLKLAGLPIEFNRQMIRIPALDKTLQLCSIPVKTHRKVFWDSLVKKLTRF